VKFSPRWWRPRHLLVAWFAYWVGFILVTLGPGLLVLWRVTRPDGHGSANASMGDGVLSANVVESGRTVWAGSIPVLNLVLLLCLPPLAMWIVWVLATSRTNNAETFASQEKMRQKELAGSDRTPGMTESFSQPSIRQKREEP
jgi:hypothetical protein